MGGKVMDELKKSLQEKFLSGKESRMTVENGSLFRRPKCHSYQPRERSQRVFIYIQPWQRNPNDCLSSIEFWFGDMYRVRTFFYPGLIRRITGMLGSHKIALRG